MGIKEIQMTTMSEKTLRLKKTGYDSETSDNLVVVSINNEDVGWQKTPIGQLYASPPEVTKYQNGYANHTAVTIRSRSGLLGNMVRSVQIGNNGEGKQMLPRKKAWNPKSKIVSDTTIELRVSTPVDIIRHLKQG